MAAPSLLSTFEAAEELHKLTKRRKDWASFLSENRRATLSSSGKKKGNRHRYAYAIPYRKEGCKIYYHYDELEKFAKYYKSLISSWR
ncbi:hypothetical protein GCM10022394_27190 [Zobellella aerophila]|uniref:Uncharacterized protein n=1 Tax=Zobellella aerophila TaxID=870480 RepID=A0ABP6W919_9GAMM